ncbi:hypothetical protein AGMMS49941_04050 [Deferribacterales bacterium]|nr:hypothetical protein AGMMS49941_04050 [Deferribacterales bacterium]
MNIFDLLRKLVRGDVILHTSYGKFYLSQNERQRQRYVEAELDIEKIPDELKNDLQRWHCA